jgi:hypothetical protein
MAIGKGHSRILNFLGALLTLPAFNSKIMFFRLFCRLQSIDIIFRRQLTNISCVHMFTITVSVV